MKRCSSCFLHWYLGTAILFGFGSKVVVTGDVTQIDLPREQASGLIQVPDILGSIEGIAFIRFTHEDVVRHKLVQRIVEAYKRHAEETGTQRQR